MEKARAKAKAKAKAHGIPVSRIGSVEEWREMYEYAWMQNCAARRDIVRLVRTVRRLGGKVPTLEARP